MHDQTGTKCCHASMRPKNAWKVNGKQARLKRKYPVQINEILGNAEIVAQINPADIFVPDNFIWCTGHQHLALVQDVRAVHYF